MIVINTRIGADEGTKNLESALSGGRTHKKHNRHTKHRICILTGKSRLLAQWGTAIEFRDPRVEWAVGHKGLVAI